MQKYQREGHCSAVEELERGRQTLFVNAAIQGKEDDAPQLPWVIELPLRKCV
jgi:hypothetical protein